MFSIYKPGQGMFVRWGTVAFAGLLVLIGLWWLSQEILSQLQVGMGVKIPVLIAFALGCAIAIFMGVNRPRPAEFMIMTESEMRKVHWPSRREVFNSTKVVIFITLVLGFLLFIVDRFFSVGFNMMHLYGKGTGS